VRLWKVELQKLAEELGFPIQVCHLPPRRACVGAPIVAVEREPKNQRTRERLLDGAE
jgi:hypothetical protein